MYIICFVVESLSSLITYGKLALVFRFVVDLLFVVLPIGSVGSVFVFVLLCITLCPF